MAKAKKKKAEKDISPENMARGDRIDYLLTRTSPGELGCSLIQFLRARRYVQKVLWSLGLGELERFGINEVTELYQVALGSGQDAKRFLQLEMDKWQLATAIQGKPVFGHGEVELKEMDIGGVKFKGTVVKV